MQPIQREWCGIFSLVSILCALAITGWMYGRNQLQTTYAGDSPDGVTLVWADQFRYCIEATGWFVQGPGGTPAGGSCPR